MRALRHTVRALAVGSALRGAAVSGHTALTRRFRALNACRRSALPSAKLKPALASPFAKPGDGKTSFSAQYAAGGIPCRINHSGVKHTLLWSRPVEDIPYDPYLLLFAEGLRETVHPHT